MARLLRWLLGYVSFVAEGGFTERFLNLCKINSISLWNVENDGVKVKAITSRKDYLKLDKAAKNSGMEINNVKERGFPSLVIRHKSRFGIVVGVAIFSLFISFMSGFIWNIEIVENDGVKLENFTEVLAEEGVKIGSRKSKIDILQVQENLLERYPNLSWVSLNIFGSKVQIEYTPIKENEPLEDVKTPKNLVATKNGKVTLVEGYRGKNEVKEGMYVVKGQLLISGVILNEDLSESFVHANGKVFAETENEITFNEELKRKNYVTTDTKSSYTFKLFGFNIPLGVKNDGLLTYSNIDLKGNGVVLPVGFVRQDSLSLTENEVSFTDAQTRLLLLEKSVEHKREFYSETEIEEINYNFFGENNKKGVKLFIKCVENIAVEGNVFAEEN